MFKVLLVALAVLALVTILGMLRRNRSASHGDPHSADVRHARAAKTAADRAIISRQGGQGAGQGGVGGGIGY